jgi:hypothetical protein
MRFFDICGIASLKAKPQRVKPQCRHLRLLYATARLSVYEGRMIASHCFSRPLLRAAVAVLLLALGLGLNGCAGMSDSMVSAFADPAKYSLYECKQLEAERKDLATRGAELQGLMAKAETGVAGSVVAELAYRNDYIAVRGQTKLAEEAWRRNKCHESPPAAAAAAPGLTPLATAKGRSPAISSGSAVY